VSVAGEQGSVVAVDDETLTELDDSELDVSELDDSELDDSELSEESAVVSEPAVVLGAPVVGEAPTLEVVVAADDVDELDLLSLPQAATSSPNPARAAIVRRRRAPVPRVAVATFESVFRMIPLAPDRCLPVPFPNARLM